MWQVASAASHHPTPEVVVLAAGSATAFAGIDLWYGLSGRISPIYLADAAVELCLLLGLALTHHTASGNARGQL
jgi:hypothetical protein